MRMSLTYIRYNVTIYRWFTKVNWMMLLNKQVEAPFVPTYSSLSDTRHFDKFTDNDITTVCDSVDLTRFEHFKS